MSFIVEWKEEKRNSEVCKTLNEALCLAAINGPIDHIQPAGALDSLDVLNEDMIVYCTITEVAE